MSDVIDRLLRFAFPACVDGVNEIRRLREMVAALESKIEQLRPYEQAAAADKRRQQREAQVQAEIAAGLRCGGGIFGCTGGPNCQFDHK